jgi:hypothetical protein
VTGPYKLNKIESKKRQTFTTVRGLGNTQASGVQGKRTKLQPEVRDETGPDVQGPGSVYYTICFVTVVRSVRRSVEGLGGVLLYSYD